MTNGEGFDVGIEFDSVLQAISKQIYDTPLAFLRENVQNAVDALRMHAVRLGPSSKSDGLSVTIKASETTCEISDNGIGMSLDDLQNLFWTIGASGKRTTEARSAGCVGMFGIGGFANFGVCEQLTVISQTDLQQAGHWTELGRADLEAAAGAIPKVRLGPSELAAPRGTIVRGVLKDSCEIEQLRRYIQDFVKYAEEPIFFNNELISQVPFDTDTEDNAILVGEPDQTWSHGSVRVHGALYEDSRHTLSAKLWGLEQNDEAIRLFGKLRFEDGQLDALKRGFKICATRIGSRIGVSGQIDCDNLAPTAGRDSLDPTSQSLLSGIVACMEHAAVLAVLESSERISRHTRIFRYVRSQGLISSLGMVEVELADGARTTLDEIKRRNKGGVKVYYATSRNQVLSQILYARGHVVVQLPGDSDKKAAVREYLMCFCGAAGLQGRVECSEIYEPLSRFERAFLSELEDTILAAYNIRKAKLIPGKLTEDLPVNVIESKGSDEIEIYLDVRHVEITKLEKLGITALFTSMVAAFCREYLGPILRSRSPKFFGTGAVNLDWLAQRRSELWILLTEDIEVLTRGTQKQVVRSSDVAVVQVGSATQESTNDPQREPKLVRIEGPAEFSDVVGYYLRIPNSASKAYGDVIQECDSRGVVWAGNKILFVASDAVSSAFQFEVRLDRLIALTTIDHVRTEGAAQVDHPFQTLFNGLYFPVPTELEAFLVPSQEKEVRIEVRCDWVDFASARAWEPRSVDNNDG